MSKRKSKSTVRVALPVALGPGAKAKSKNKKKKKAAGAASLSQEMSFPLPPYVKVMVEPSSADLEMSQRPDFNSAPTVPWREKGAFTASTNADGNLLVDFVASIRETWYVATFNAGLTTVASMAANNVSNYTELTTTFSSYRPYILEVVAEYVGEAQLQKGVLGCAVTNLLQNTGDMTTLFDEPTYKEVPSNLRVAARAYFADNGDFIAPTSVSYGGTDPIEVLHFIGSGLPASTACIRFNWCLVFEGAVGHQQLLSRTASHSVAHPAQVATVANIVGANTRTAAGSNPIATLTKYADRMARIGAQLNGLYQASKPVLSLMQDFVL